MEKNNCLTLSKEFIEFCKLNGIEDVELYAKEIFNIGFNFKKYGTKPGGKDIPPPPPPPPVRIVNERGETIKKKKTLYDE